MNQSQSVDSNTFLHLARSAAVIKRIPRSARQPCSALLSTLIDDAVRHVDSLDKWSLLMNFASIVLQKPSRGGRKHNIGKLICSRVAKWPNLSIDPIDNFGSSKRKSGSLSAEELRAKAAVSKLEDGNIRAAVRIICSSDEPAADSAAATLDALIANIPMPPADICFPNISLDGPFEPLQVSEDYVRRAVISFPPGSSGSLDSLSPQHLKDMIGLDGSPELLPSLTSLRITSRLYR